MKSRGLGVADLLIPKRQAILELGHRHGATHIRVFGSVARGEARADSDVDLIVEWDYDRISPWGGAGLFLELESLIGHSIDITTVEQLPARIRDRVLRESVDL
ncbi:MAG: nucleotidyltransferase domain-containing protein [Chloroflexota bacterium]|nr:nucleotidyltransferase domain-containing protein [Chloroflexota bacterium]